MMNKTMKNSILNKLKQIIKFTASSSVNFSCTFIFGQEDIPNEVKKLRKF